MFCDTVYVDLLPARSEDAQTGSVYTILVVNILSGSSPMRTRLAPRSTVASSSPSRPNKLDYAHSRGTLPKASTILVYACCFRGFRPHLAFSKAALTTVPQFSDVSSQRSACPG